MTKNDLIDNVRAYTPEQIAEAIKNGVVSLYELKSLTHGQFSPLMQRQVQKLLFSNDGSVGKPQQVQRNEENVTASQSSVINIPEETVKQTETPVEAETTQAFGGKFEPVKQPESYSEHAKTLNYEEKFEPVNYHTGSESPYNGVETPSSLTVEQPSQEESQTYEENVPVTYCSECGYQFPANMSACPNCGMPRTDSSEEMHEGNHEHAQGRIGGIENDYDNEGTPANLNSFSMGAFVFGWIWGVFNGVYWSLVLLCLEIIGKIAFLIDLLSRDFDINILDVFDIESFDDWGMWMFICIACILINLVVRIILGVVGNRMAWKSRHSSDVREFVRSQKIWRNLAWTFIGIIIVVIVLLILNAEL